MAFFIGLANGVLIKRETNGLLGVFGNESGSGDRVIEGVLMFTSTTSPIIADRLVLQNINTDSLTLYNGTSVLEKSVMVCDVSDWIYIEGEIENLRGIEGCGCWVGQGWGGVEHYEGQ